MEDTTSLSVIPCSSIAVLSEVTVIDKVYGSKMPFSKTLVLILTDHMIRLKFPTNISVFFSSPQQFCKSKGNTNMKYFKRGKNMDYAHVEWVGYLSLIHIYHSAAEQTLASLVHARASIGWAFFFVLFWIIFFSVSLITKSFSRVLTNIFSSW